MHHSGVVIRDRDRLHLPAGGIKISYLVGRNSGGMEEKKSFVQHLEEG